MSIIRRTLNPQGWTSVPNAALEDERLSYRARGILGYLLSRPDGWVTDSERMAQKGKEGRDAIRTALRELEAVGYVHKRMLQGTRGTWTTERYVYDRPVTSIEDAENPMLDPVDNSVETWGQPTPENPSPGPGKPTPENPALLTTNQNNLKKEKGDPTSKAPHLVPPEYEVRALLVRALRAPVDLADARRFLSAAETFYAELPAGYTFTAVLDGRISAYAGRPADFERDFSSGLDSGSASVEKDQAPPGLTDSLATLDRAAPRPSIDQHERAESDV